MDLVPTTKLRFVERREVGKPTLGIAIETSQKILQQWFSPDMPAYMQSGEGEWRDVAVESES